MREGEEELGGAGRWEKGGGGREGSSSRREGRGGRTRGTGRHRVGAQLMSTAVPTLGSVITPAPALVFQMGDGGLHYFIPFP